MIMVLHMTAKHASSVITSRISSIFLIFFSSSVTGNRYGGVSELGTGVCVCDVMHSCSDCQPYGMFLCVPMCASYTGEWPVHSIH